MRTIGIVTVGRSDYGIYLPVLRLLRETPGIALWIFASGAHLESRFGYTVRDIEADGFEIRERVPVDLKNDSAAEIALSMGLGVSGFATALARSRPDILVVLGDRFDMFPAAIAALPMRIPLAHIHGGETTEGAMDESVRHAITKLSHLHFPSTEIYARRLVQLGEEPWRITVSGAPALDNVTAMPRMSRGELAAKTGIPLVAPPLLVTYHPATLQKESPAEQVVALLAGLESWCGPIVFTGVNADAGHRAIREAVEKFVARRTDARLVENLGTTAYFSLMALAAAMIGNSSSGLIEAPSFELPVVNIGPRQQGRVRAANVIDTGCGASEIEAAIRRAVLPEFRRSLAGIVNPYGDGHAAPRIVARLKVVELDDRLIVKRFQDVRAEADGTPS